MIKKIRGDLHIHTCLSPCADLTMSPKRVVERAVRMGLDMIAICDHNSAENVKAAMAAAMGENIVVLPGMEVTTTEEVHIVALFEEPEAAMKLQNVVYGSLPDEMNQAEVFGEQVVANELDEVESFNNHLLMTATRLTVDRLVDTVHELKGLAVAAHIDREVFGFLGQLGFIPEDVELDAIEISSLSSPKEMVEQNPEIARFPIISSSDAHRLEDIGNVSTSFLMEKAGFEELRRALTNTGGRKVETGAR